ncbi:vWA domain-containing protein [Phytoactinopolyspora endophytica]|uniref:vWA domain-containing protein n=1 Tax=Phytoactinopolyspora endophytica TaxID=1642495 RepID=UPI00101D0D84|nr:VWA domain-containing protein [Phytoactinopolyspora endophytica]
MPYARRLLAIVATLLLSVAAASSAHAQLSQSTQPSDNEMGSLMLVLDSSGSMEEPDASGTTRIEAARTALHSVVDDLPDEATVGMRVFGASVFSRSDAGACEDSQLVVPIDTGNQSDLKAAIDEYEPYGETPISYALEEAAADLGDEGQRTILLVSDGEANCDPDPCEVAEDIAARGIDLRIDVVGFDVDGAARNQLSCIADKGNGTYYDAENTEELTESLDTVAARAMQPFEVTGTPVEGTPEYNGAPELEAGGQYVDTVPELDAQKFYTIDRSAEGSNIIVGASGRPDDRGQLEMRIETADGDECDWNYATALNDTGYSLVAGSVATLTQFHLDPDDPCATADDLRLRIQQNTTAGTADFAGTPIQFKLWEYSAAGNYDDLPEPQQYNDIPWEEINPDRGDTSEVDGAPSFGEAPELEPGESYTDTVVPGEMRLFRVPVEWGQRLQAQVDVDPADGALRDQLDAASTIGTRVYGPAGGDATDIAIGERMSEMNLRGTAGAQVHASTVEVRYRNLESVHEFMNAASIAGDYYIAVSVSEDGDGDEYEVPFTLTTSLIGEAGAGAPEFTTVELPEDGNTTEDPADDATDEPEDDSEPSADATDTPADDGTEDETPAEAEQQESDTTQTVASDSEDGGLTPATVGVGVGGLLLLTGGGYGIYRFMRMSS